MIHNVILLLP